MSAQILLPAKMNQYAQVTAMGCGAAGGETLGGEAGTATGSGCCLFGSCCDILAIIEKIFFCCGSCRRLVSLKKSKRETGLGEGEPDGSFLFSRRERAAALAGATSQISRSFLFYLFLFLWAIFSKNK